VALRQLAIRGPAMSSKIRCHAGCCARGNLSRLCARVWTFGLYTAENNLPKGISQPSQIIGPNGVFAQSLGNDASQHYAEMASAQLLAEQSGGRAFVTNGCLT